VKIAFFDTDNYEKEYFVKHLKSCGELSFFPNPVSEVEVEKLKDHQIFSGFVYSKFPKDLIAKFPTLKLISTQSTGYDHIDIEYCKQNNIQVCNVPEYGSSTVAEHAFALILALAKNLPKSIERVKEGVFSPEGLTGIDLKGKTLGVVGTGKIGVNVIKIAKGFGMTVIAYDPFPKKDLEKFLGFNYQSLETVLINSDIVTLHCPYSEKTKHLINSANIGLLKPHCLIINTARGALIETQALYNALIENKIGGAGLDVLEEEGFLQEERELLCKGTTCKENVVTAYQNNVLLKLQDVIVTPHNAFNSKEALERILATTVDNILAFQSGHPINSVLQ